MRGGWERVDYSPTCILSDILYAICLMCIFSRRCWAVLTVHNLRCLALPLLVDDGMAAINGWMEDEVVWWKRWCCGFPMLKRAFVHNTQLSSLETHNNNIAMLCYMLPACLSHYTHTTQCTLIWLWLFASSFAFTLLAVMGLRYASLFC